MQAATPVIEFLSSRFLRLSNTLALYAGRRYREEFGLTLPEWRTLSIVGWRGQTSAIEISRILRADKAWVGLSVDKLVARGYISREIDVRDRRRALLRPTASGQAVFEAVMAAAQQRQDRLLGALPAGAAEMLVASLDRLQHEADRMLEEIEAAGNNAAKRRRAA